MPTPLVSVCIPTYNGAEYIAEAMDSAIAQTYPNLEIIVSDDASIDGTLEIIEAYKSKTAIPIQIFHHKPHGIGANWNHCIQKANGEYIKFLFQDDVLLPECIAKMVSLMESDPLVAIVASKREFILEPNFLNPETKKWIERMKDLQYTLELPDLNGISYLDNRLFCSNKFFESPLNKIGEPSTILFRKDLVNTIGYFREDLNQVLDYEFCYRVLTNMTIAIINSPLVKFRLHNLQATVRNKDNAIFGVDHRKMEYIVYTNYLKYLSPHMRKVLLRKYNKWVSRFYDTIDNIKQYMPK